MELTTAIIIGAIIIALSIPSKKKGWVGEPEPSRFTKVQCPFPDKK